MSTDLPYPASSGYETYKRRVVMACTVHSHVADESASIGRRPRLLCAPPSNRYGGACLCLTPDPTNSASTPTRAER